MPRLGFDRLLACFLRLLTCSLPHLLVSRKKCMSITGALRASQAKRVQYLDFFVWEPVCFLAFGVPSFPHSLSSRKNCWAVTAGFSVCALQKKKNVKLRLLEAPVRRSVVFALCFEASRKKCIAS